MGKQFWEAWRSIRCEFIAFFVGLSLGSVIIGLIYTMVIFPSLMIPSTADGTLILDPTLARHKAISICLGYHVVLLFAIVFGCFMELYRRISTKDSMEYQPILPV
ncbi:hypothetical protein AAC387_Pa07g3609 [Persea americana]